MPPVAVGARLLPAVTAGDGSAIHQGVSRARRGPTGWRPRAPGGRERTDQTANEVVDPNFQGLATRLLGLGARTPSDPQTRCFGGAAAPRSPAFPTTFSLEGVFGLKGRPPGGELLYSRRCGIDGASLTNVCRGRIRCDEEGLDINYHQAALASEATRGWWINRGGVYSGRGSPGKNTYAPPRLIHQPRVASEATAALWWWISLVFMRLLTSRTSPVAPSPRWSEWSRRPRVASPASSFPVQGRGGALGAAAPPPRVRKKFRLIL